MRDHLIQAGPIYGYYPNPSKIWLVVEDDYHAEAATLFEDSGVAVISEGRRHLGADIGKKTFVESYIQQKVLTWTHEVEHLASIAKYMYHPATCSLCCLHLWTQ